MSSPFPLPPAYHYENFPVGSWLLPKALRPAMAALYQFARYADDVADEGNFPAVQRLAELDSLARAVAQPAAASHPVVSPLTPWMSRLEPAQLLALLEAFSFDVRSGAIEDEVQMQWYCQRSANPVGRLVLQLFGYASAQRYVWSDAICSALQQINFLQDIAKDLQRSRRYLPAQELSLAGLDIQGFEASAKAGCLSPPQRNFLAIRAAKAQRLLDTGRPLIRDVPGRLSLELRAIVAGGQTVLDRLATTGYDPIQDNCRLRRRDAPRLLWNLLR